jgi:RNA polymerase sigma factor (sigma-70 family)
MVQDPDQRLADVVRREQSRLRWFIRRRVPNAEDVEDILQDVFAELVEANRRLMPIDHVTAWLFQVTRNRITDLLRRKRPERFSDALIVTDDGERMRVEDLVPSAEAGPDAVYARQVLAGELERALADCLRTSAAFSSRTKSKAEASEKSLPRPERTSTRFCRASGTR